MTEEPPVFVYTSYRFRVFRFVVVMMGVLLSTLGTCFSGIYWVPDSSYPVVVIANGLFVWFILRWYLKREHRDMFAPVDDLIKRLENN